MATKKSGKRSKQRSVASVKPTTQPPTAAVRIARVAKGKKPQYFSDPAIDKLLWMTVSLMEELSVTRDRLDTLERLLDRRKLLRTTAIEAFVPDGKAAQERDARRAAYVERVMRAVQAELEEITGDGKPRAEDDAVAAVSS